jgi:Elongation factor Tu domain 2
MATRKAAKGKSKPKLRKTSAAKPTTRKKIAKVGKKPAKKAPVQRAVPRKARPAAKPAPGPAAKPKRASAPPKPVAAAPAPTPPPQPAPPPGERIGVVTHYYGHVSVAIIRLESGLLRVGDTIHIRGHTTDFSQRVQSMEVEHRPVTEAGPNDDFGLKVTAHTREHDVVYKVK